MTTSTAPTATGTTPAFTRDDITRIVDAERTVTAFKAFLYDRLAAYTHYTEVTDHRGSKIIIDNPRRDSGGYGRWEIRRDWLDIVANASVDDTETAIGFTHYLADDRGGGGSYGATVNVPVAFIFGEIEDAEQYAEYLRLKAIYDPRT